MGQTESGRHAEVGRRAVLGASLLAMAAATACTEPGSATSSIRTAGTAPPGAEGSAEAPAPTDGVDTPATTGSGTAHVRLSPFSWRAVDGEYRGSSGAHLAALVRSRHTTLRLESPGSIAYRVNGGAWQYSAGTGAVTLRMEPSLTWPANLVEAVLIDSWGIFRGIGVEQGGSILSLPEDGGPRIFALGDSITEGGGVGPDGSPHAINALLAYPAALREVLGAAVGVSASGGRGWLDNSPLRETWADLDNHRMDFRSPPDVVVIMAGGGEPDAPGLGQAVRETLADMLETLPQTHVLVLGHTNAGSPAVRTINREADAFKDVRVHFVDAAPWINPSSDTTDGVHHAGFVGRAIMAPRIAREVRRILGSISPR